MVDCIAWRLFNHIERQLFVRYLESITWMFVINVRTSDVP